MEEWKLFKRLPKTSIFVSSEGRVKSVNNKTSSEKQLSLYKRGGRGGKKYLGFGYKDGKIKILVCVHIAVGELFVGPKPDNDHQLDHKNGDTFNNFSNNLQWLPSKINQSKGNKPEVKCEWKPVEGWD